MHSARIADLLRLGPGGHTLFERDVAASGDVARLIAGLANGDGGTILFGAGEGRAAGIDHTGGAFRRIAAGAQRVTPPLLLEPQLATLDGRNMILLDVPRGADPPYAVDGQIWVRGRKGIHAANTEQATDLARRALSSVTLAPAAGSGRLGAKGPFSVDLEHILLKLERLIAANAELTRKLEDAGSWRSRIVDQLIGALIGLALSVLVFYLLGIG